MNYPDDLINAERWATKIQRAKEKNVLSQFPPIIPQSSLNKIKYYESKAAHMRALSPFDSDDESTSIYGSEYSYYTDTSIESLSFESSPRHIPTSMMAVLSAESGVEDEVLEKQTVTPTVEKRHKKKPDFVPNKELDKIYKLYVPGDDLRAAAKAPVPTPALDSSDASLMKSFDRSKGKRDSQTICGK